MRITSEFSQQTTKCTRSKCISLRGSCLCKELVKVVHPSSNTSTVYIREHKPIR